MEQEATVYNATLELDETDRPVRLHVSSATAGDVELELYPTERSGVFEVRQGDTRFPVVLRSDGVSKIDVDLRGYRYTAKVLADHHHRLLSILRASPAMQARVAKISSPMPGLIKSVFVGNGDEVAKGDTLFSLEAMKMENAIASPMAGIVRDLSASDGKAVEKGAILCVIEPITA